MATLDADQIIHHFSHQHPLKLLSFQPQMHDTVTCSGCKRNASGWIYICETCNYCLHKPCSKIPQTLSHQADQNHSLVLLSSPAYPEGAFKCNACGGSGTGFSYHCGECELDIHTICAFMPSSTKHIAHDHTLHLFFSPPYNNKVFSCDICNGTGSNHWLYRCDSCEFDAHMKCAKANTQNRTTSTIQQSQQLQLNKSSSAPPQIWEPINDSSSSTRTIHYFSPHGPSPTLQQQNIGIPYNQTQHPIPGNVFSNPYPQAGAPILVVPEYGQPPRRNNLVDGIVGNVIEGIVDGLAQQAGQALLDGILGSS